MEKLNLTQQKHTSPIKEMHYNTKKLKPCLVASYDIRPGSGEVLFWFWHFINLSLTYFLKHLHTYLQPWYPHGAYVRVLRQLSEHDLA